jgi:hypothetical protein
MLSSPRVQRAALRAGGVLRARREEPHHPCSTAVLRSRSKISGARTARTCRSRARHPRIRLTAPDGSSLVIGWCNVSDRKAELHTLGHTLALSKQRYGYEAKLPPLEYLKFLDVAQRVLEDQGLSVMVVAFARPSVEGEVKTSKSTAPPPRRSQTLPYYVTDAVATVGALARRVIA